MLFAVHDDDDPTAVCRRRIEALFEESAAHERSPEQGYLMALAALRLAVDRWQLVLPPYLECEIEQRGDELESFAERAEALLERVQAVRDLRQDTG